MAAERFVSGPADREDRLAKTSLSILFSSRGLGRSPGRFFGGCRSLPLDVTYIILYIIF